MRSWNDIDLNYIETFKFRINVLFRSFYQERFIKDLLAEVNRLAEEYRGKWFELYVRWFQLLNRYKRRGIFYGELEWKVESFLKFELMGQKEARWKLNEKVSSEVDVISLSIAQLDDVVRTQQTPKFKAEVIAKPVVKNKVDVKDILLTGATTLGVGLIFAGVITLTVLLWPVSVPLMVSAIVGAGIMGMISGFGLKRLVDYCFKERTNVHPEKDVRPTVVDNAYRALLDPDRKPSLVVSRVEDMPKRVDVKKLEVKKKENKEDTLQQYIRTPGVRSFK